MTNDRMIKAIALISVVSFVAVISTLKGGFVDFEGGYLQEHVMLAIEMDSLDSGHESDILVVHTHNHIHTHTPMYAPPDEAVLGLLFPPGIHGGYRNQILRLIGLVAHALSNDIQYILLDSLISVTHLPEKYVPFGYLFDVDHWNSFREHLPLLVDYHESSNYSCWTRQGDRDVINMENAASSPANRNGTHSQHTHTHTYQNVDEIIKRGFFAPIYNRSLALMNGTEAFNMNKLRNLDLLDEARKCKGNPIPFGGGIKAGNLWNTYLRKNNITIQSYVLQALRPKQKWRDLSMSCVEGFTENYLGLHLRMEMDMIGHKCGRNMEHNATRLFHNIDKFLSTLNNNTHQNQATTGSTHIDAISIATSRKEMEVKHGRHYETYKVYADENLETLNHFTKSKNKAHILGGNEVSVFECGGDLVRRYLDEKENEHEKKIDYGSVLPMMIDFHMLTEAKIFIGVRKSSYSNDVWATRYYQGKGMHNYEYTPEGIFPIENGGLPPPHVNC